jgi:uncharacterized Zn-binding protein involved in type VI secretion
MPAVTRAGDRVISPDGSGKKCRFPMRTSVGQVNSVNVYVNGILVPVSGNLVAPHPKSGCSPDTSTLSGSSKVFVGGQGIGRLGDKYGDNIVTKGSSNVFAG